MANYYQGSKVVEVGLIRVFTQSLPQGKQFRLPSTRPFDNINAVLYQFKCRKYKFYTKVWMLTLQIFILILPRLQKCIWCRR